MEYKKKLTALLSVIAALAIVYAASYIFNPEVSSSRSASYSWLDSKLSGRVSRIVLSQPNSGEKTEIIKNNGKWFVLNNGIEYPARQLRVDDFISVFTARSAWSVRSSGASSHARLGLTETASRITIYGENSTLLDLLIGVGDSTGREVYLRRYGQNEVRSGENRIGSYLGSVKSWYNLSLIPESEDGKSALNGVQRLSVYTDAGQQIFSLNNKAWTLSGIVVEKPDQSAINSYINSVLNIEGDDFIDSIKSDDPMLNHSRIVLEFGNGNVRTIRFSESDENGGRYAAVSTSDNVYSISPWTAQSLFKNAWDFESQGN